MGQFVYKYHIIGKLPFGQGFCQMHQDFFPAHISIRFLDSQKQRALIPLGMRYGDHCSLGDTGTPDRLVLHID